MTFESIVGSESLQVALVCHELGDLLVANSRASEARAFYERALGVRRRLLGDGHPDVATTRHNLAVLHESEGRVSEARALWAEARAALEPTAPAGARSDSH
jgi:hypothetical protein